MKKLIIALIAIAAAVWVAYSDWPRVESGGDLTLYGNVDIREVQLGFRVPGRLQEMQVEEGDTVAAGDLLAALDAGPLEHGLALAQANLAQAQAQLQGLQAGSRSQEIEQARARVAEATATYENADHEFKRQQELVKKKLSSERLLDNAVAHRDQAVARIRANQEALDLAIEGARSEDIAAAEAALAAAAAQWELARTQVDDTRLLAPSPGVILTRAREPGSILPAGAPVYSLSLTETIYVRAYVSEVSLGVVVPGTEVVVTTDSSEKRYFGQVGFVSPRAEFTPKSVETPELRTDLVYRLRVVVSNPDTALRQGMPVTVTVPAA
ncbi:MAG: HlyD family secretion protein [Halieaceae bacterium]|jgi:HlyD family secretion protein